MSREKFTQGSVGDILTPQTPGQTGTGTGDSDPLADFVGVKELHRRFPHLSVSRLYHLANMGRLPYTKFSGRLLFRVSDILSLLEARTRGGIPPLKGRKAA